MSPEEAGPVAAVHSNLNLPLRIQQGWSLRIDQQGRVSLKDIHKIALSLDLPKVKHATPIAFLKSLPVKRHITDITHQYGRPIYTVAPECVQEPVVSSGRGEHWAIEELAYLYAHRLDPDLFYSIRRLIMHPGDAARRGEQEDTDSNAPSAIDRAFVARLAQQHDTPGEAKPLGALALAGETLTFTGLVVVHSDEMEHHQAVQKVCRRMLRAIRKRQANAVKVREELAKERTAGAKENDGIPSVSTPQPKRSAKPVVVETRRKRQYIP